MDPEIIKLVLSTAIVVLMGALVLGQYRSSRYFTLVAWSLLLIPVVGAWTAVFLLFKDYLLIGSSLGCHIVGSNAIMSARYSRDPKTVMWSYEYWLVMIISLVFAGGMASWVFLRTP